MWTISLPLSVFTNKKETSKFILNLNGYRNANFHTLNSAKIKFKEKVAPLVRHLPKLRGCTLEFKLFPATKQLCDVSNVCSIQEKFFNDALVELNKLDDDNYTIIPESRYNFGGVDPKNPRVEVTITPTEVTEEEETMQITLIQTEIEEAIVAHVRNQITVKDGMRIDIELRATRGAEGSTAIVNIVPEGTAQEAPAPAPVAKPIVRPVVKPAAAPVAAQTPAPAPTPTAETSDPVADALNAGGSEEQQEEQQEEAQAETAAAPAAAPATPRKSLFSGLSKPVNG